MYIITRVIKSSITKCAVFFTVYDRVARFGNKRSILIRLRTLLYMYIFFVLPFISSICIYFVSMNDSFI